MAVLITGGKGFVGRQLVERLKGAGHSVVLFEGDIKDKNSVLNFTVKNQITAVVHLAAKIGGRDKEETRRVNVDGTSNIVEFCRKFDVPRLIFLSSIKVLSSGSDPYVDSKRAAEKIITDSNVPYIILRPGMIYGPGDKKNLGLLVKAARRLFILPVLNFKIQPVFVSDLTKIIEKCLTADLGRILNIAGVGVIDGAGVLKSIKSCGYKFLTLNAPGIFAFFAKIFSLLPFSPITFWQIKSLLSGEIYKSDDWQMIFDVKATSFAEGMAVVCKET